MARIKIDFDGLNSSSTSLNSYIQSYEALNIRMDALREKVTAGWEGEASRAFLEMMQNYSKEAQKMTEVLKQFWNYGTSASADFDDVDRRCAAMIRNAF